MDSAVIGAGIIGLACAERLSRAGRSIVVLERHDRPIQETSSRSSQVVHAGLYYPTGTWKARLCVSGNRALYGWCEAHGVPHARLGKLVVATTPDEEPELHRLLAQGQANGVPNLSLADTAFVRAKEPDVRATAALWSPDTGVLDVHALAESLVAEASSRGATFAWRHRLTALERSGDAWALRLDGPDGQPVTLRARHVVNAAGLDSDTIAALAGIDLDTAGYRLHYAKGRYFRLKAKGRVRHLVYPVPAAHLAGLGVHVTVGLDGDVRLGPDVTYLPDRRIDYAVPESLGPDFARAAARFLPFVTPELVEPDQAGIRPKLSGSGEPFRDFVIAEESARGLPGLVNLVGLESPGLTCALEIAREVEALLG
ncbi:MAG: NAD(P)/FAD-dependent oxidoreductase [Deltaproteobacteria bacterium]|nr:NAD(P)/FAD-dependent oxidoreductase [Deltaproteobacteria bacterium]